MSDNLNALLGRDKYDQFLRDAEAARRTKVRPGPAGGIRMWLARALVRLAFALAQVEGSGWPQPAGDP